MPGLSSQKCTLKLSGYSLGAFFSICTADTTRKKKGNVEIRVSYCCKHKRPHHSDTKYFSGIVLFFSYLPESQNFYATSGEKKIWGTSHYSFCLINTLDVRWLRKDWTFKTESFLNSTQQVPLNITLCCSSTQAATLIPEKTITKSRVTKQPWGQGWSAQQPSWSSRSCQWGKRLA